MIVDIHAHYGQWLSTSRPDTPDDFIRVLDRFGIDATIVSSGRAILYDLEGGNAQVADLTRRDPRVYGAIVVNPNRRDESLAELARYGNGERFVAVKHHPDYSGAPVNSPLALPLLRRAEEMGLPYFVHTWGEEEVEAAASAARAFPDLSIFMFHMGADAWRLAIRRALEYPNLHLETISSLPEPARVRSAVEALGARRVFFGTDMTLFTPAYGIGIVKGAGLSQADQARVMGENALEFFRFKVQPKERP